MRFRGKRRARPYSGVTVAGKIENLKPFKKNDPRINRKGRPKSFDALRALAQQIAHEAALKNGEPLVIEGHIITVTEAILRTWAQSKDPRLQQAFIEVAFGKVPQRQELSGPDGGAIIIDWGDYATDTD